MYILIDRERMCVLYKNEQLNTLLNLAHIEVSHVATIIINSTFPVNFDILTDLELKLMFENMCGQKPTTYSKETLIKDVMRQCNMLEESKLNGFEISLQAASISMENAGFFKYAPGCTNASAQAELFVPKPLVTVAGYTPTHNPNRTPYTPPARATVTASTPAVTTQTRAAPCASANNSSPAVAPKQGSKTGRVWQIAESILEQHPARPIEFKALRGLIVTQCEAEGINSSTAGVQYSKWRLTKI